MSELGGPSRKLFRFVLCVRARGAYVRSDLGENVSLATFPFPFSGGRFSLFPLPSKVLSSFSWLYRYFFVANSNLLKYASASYLDSRAGNWYRMAIWRYDIVSPFWTIF